MAIDGDLQKRLTEELTIDVPTAGRLFKLERNAAYRAVKSGAIPSIRFGGKIVVPTAPLGKMLGIEAA